jgi:hypothetical protein
MKRNNKKAMPKGSNFHRKHDPKIEAGEAQSFDGWVDAGVECYERFGGNASAYAKASVNGFTVSQTENTIRQYVGAVVTLLRKHKTKAGVLSAYDAVYETREIGALRALARGKGEREAGKKRSTSAVALTKRSAHNAWNKAKSFDEFWELISE